MFNYNFNKLCFFNQRSTDKKSKYIQCSNKQKKIINFKLMYDKCDQYN